MRFSRLGLPLLIVCLLTGCDIGLQDAAKIVGEKLDKNTARVVVAFLTAVDKAQKESQEWRDLVDKTREDFAKCPTRARIEGMAITDFLLDRAKENLGELSAITGQLEHKEYAAALKAFVALQSTTARKSPPRIGTIYPDSIDFTWRNEHPEPVDQKLTTVLFVGYNFDPNNKSNYAVELQNSQGHKLRTAHEHLIINTPYLAQVDVTPGSGVAIREGETRLALLYKNAAVAVVPITWGKRLQPAPSAPPRDLVIGKLIKGRHVFEGRIGKLTIAEINDEAVVEIKDAAEVVCGLVDGRSQVNINAQADVTFAQRIDGRSHVTVNTRGHVSFHDKIDGQSNVAVTTFGNVTVARKIDGQCQVKFRTSCRGDVVIGEKIDGQCVVSVPLCRVFIVKGKVDGGKQTVVSVSYTDTADIGEKNEATYNLLKK